MESFLKKSSQMEFEFFFDSTHPHETKASLSIAFRLIGARNYFILRREM